MEGDPAARAREAAEAVYRSESRRVLATLVRLLGDFDLAEEALHDAFAEALAAWPGKGVPDNPRAWLVAVGRRRAVDALRRRSRFDASLGRIAARVEAEPAAGGGGPPRPPPPPPPRVPPPPPRGAPAAPPPAAAAPPAGWGRRRGWRRTPPSPTTASASSSPAATRWCPRRRASRSPCGRSAA